MKRALWIACVAGAAVAACYGQARADVILTGPDSNDGDYSAATLEAAATSTDTVSSGGVSGISLWGLLGGASTSGPVYGAITTSTPAGDNGKNAILRYYVLATGSDGSQSVISLGEIDPTFGGTAPDPAFIAFENTGGGLLASPELVIPSGPGRDVSNLVSLQLLAVPALSGGGGVSTSVDLSGAVAKPGNYTLTDLENDFTPTTETVNGDNYTGVQLFDFIDPTITDGIVVTAGTDGYEVVLSLAELDPSLGGNTGDLLPYADTAGNFPGDGVARTILPSDNAHGRWESNLDEVEVLSVPEPGSLLLFAAALASFGLLARRLPRRNDRLT